MCQRATLMFDLVGPSAPQTLDTETLDKMIGLLGERASFLFAESRQQRAARMVDTQLPKAQRKAFRFSSVISATSIEHAFKACQSQDWSHMNALGQHPWFYVHFSDLCNCEEMR